MWINQQILEREEKGKRALVIKYFISVAEVRIYYVARMISHPFQKCHVLQNYSTMAAMVSGLNTPPIRRLKRTWQQVGARGMASLESCERLFDSNKNFSNYRQVLATVQAPCVPFLGKRSSSTTDKC
jgi:son of sevenless-like protein